MGAYINSTLTPLAAAAVTHSTQETNKQCIKNIYILKVTAALSLNNTASRYRVEFRPWWCWEPWLSRKRPAASHLAELSRLCSSISMKLFAGVKRRYSTTLIYGDGSADHGDKHTGHVRKTVQDT